MAPITKTPEYALLKEVLQADAVHKDKLNTVALNKAIADGYVKFIGDHVLITDAGYDRYDTINDR